MEELEVLRVDDLPLLYTQVKELGVQQTIDNKIVPHGNWSGISLGHLISLWLCYLLSESNHRLSPVENWATENLTLLGALSGELKISGKDFTDDRLEQALDYISKPSNWMEISIELNRSGLSVYDLSTAQTVRLDSAPMQGHHQVKPGGLFQYGYSKHHDPRLGMLKVMLASVDNEINGFGYPLAHLTVSGEKADDGLYIPLIKECEQVFKNGDYNERKLYIGDSKIGSVKNRSYIVSTKNDYLTPLSKVQLSATARNKKINEKDKKDYKKVYKKGKTGKRELVAQGFEEEVNIDYMDSDGIKNEWKERRVFVLSTAYSLTQKKALDNRLIKVETEIKDLVIIKQGKTIPVTEVELQQRIDELLEGKGLGQLLNIEIKKEVQVRQIRAYKDRPARMEKKICFSLKINRNEEAIETHKKTLGWQVYATSAKKKNLNFEKCVWKYRYQNRVERQFDNLRNKVVPLVPIFVQQDNRVEALINLLMICLKVCAVMEYKVARQLKVNQEELDNVYEGNPKRSTASPTANRLLKSFKGISLVIIGGNKLESVPTIKLTHLKQVQLKIIKLLGFQQDLYEDLVAKIQLFFLKKKISET